MIIEDYQHFYDIIHLFDKLSPEDKIEFKEIRNYIRNELLVKHHIQCDIKPNIHPYNELLKGIIESIQEYPKMDRMKRIQELLINYYPKQYSRFSILSYFFSCNFFTK
jgi:hypothetical protein